VVYVTKRDKEIKFSSEPELRFVCIKIQNMVYLLFICILLVRAHRVCSTVSTETLLVFRSEMRLDGQPASIELKTLNTQVEHSNH